MQKTRSRSIVWRLAAVLVLIGALVLTGCPSDNAGVLVDVNQTVPVTNAAAAADLLGSQTFTFANGVQEFGTTTTTSVVFGAQAIRATINANNTAANSDVQYASCTFFNFTGNGTGPLAPGAPALTINTCNVQVTAGSVPTNDSRTTGSAVLVFNNNPASSAVAVDVRVDPSGTLTVNNTAGGTVPVTGSAGQ